MNCDHAQLLLSARIDGEILPADRAAIDAHLQSCESCRATFDAVLEDDAVMRAAFAGRRTAAENVAETVIGRLGISGSQPKRSAAESGCPSIRWTKWATPLLAAAAGFALAVVLIRPGGSSTLPRQATTAPSAAGVARLALATGQVDICPADEQTFFACPTGGPIAAGTRVRTGPKVRCELKMSDGSEIRLNDQTEITVRGARSVAVATGQMFSVVAKSPAEPSTGAAAPFVVDASPVGTRLVALGTEFDVACAPGNPQATLTVVEGAVRVGSTTITGGPSANGDDVIHAGQSATLAAGTPTDRRQVHSLAAATQWVDELLMMKGRDNPELARRLDDLLAQLGQSKMSYLASQEVRRLGDHCVLPLTRYIESDKSKGPEQLSRRREAARIISDVSTTSSVPELINLLADADGEVRFHAARALERLTGQIQGLRPEQWRDQAWTSCVPSVERWHAWWGQNKSKLPGCDPDAVRPIEVAKEQLEPKGKG